MKDEMQDVIRGTEDLGDNVYRMSLVIPEITLDVIKVTRAIAAVPWSMVTGTLDYSAGKVDDLTDMAP